MKYSLILFFLVIWNINPGLLAQSLDNPAGSQPEYMILTVTHYLKREGVEARMQVNLGEATTHSMRGVIEKGEAGAVIFRIEDKMIILRNEVDFLNLVSQYGFKVQSVHKFLFMGKENFQYLLVKE
jgi:hypothetical protein